MTIPAAQFPPCGAKSRPSMKTCRRKTCNRSPKPSACLVVGARTGAPVLDVFSLLALAAIRICGVMSYLVSRRTREIGLRMAWGAEDPRCHKFIVKQGVMLQLCTLVTRVLSLKRRGLLAFGHEKQHQQSTESIARVDVHANVLSRLSIEVHDTRLD